MRLPREIGAVLSALALCVCLAPEQAAGQTAAERDWSFSGSVYTYFVHDDQNYVQPTVTADRDWLHLEARYNYESLHTGSLWMGYNFSGGDKLAWEVTPILGGVFGDTGGIAPGYKGSLTWRWLDVYSEGEYLRDTRDVSDSFFYSWSEVAVTAPGWLRWGLVGQRTRVYQTDREIQRGILIGYPGDRLSAMLYVLNPDEHHPTVVLSAVVNF